MRRFPTVEPAEQQFDDDAAKISRIHNDGGRAVKAAAVEALRKQDKARLEDARVEMPHMLNGAGRGITKAVNELMDHGTREQIREFAATGRHTARSKDESHGTGTRMGTGTAGAKGGVQPAVATGTGKGRATATPPRPAAPPPARSPA
ncbi:hypothetical protein AB0F18_15030 [Streptomyces sp. NPDC029216]|uniref:hypothetical protein n=1 Tax=Streptomyces sp. NPDC029216 TaxID=3154701 RepID=UPI0033F49DF9